MPDAPPGAPVPGSRLLGAAAPAELQRLSKRPMPLAGTTAAAAAAAAGAGGGLGPVPGLGAAGSRLLAPGDTRGGPRQRTVQELPLPPLAAAAGAGGGGGALRRAAGGVGVGVSGPAVKDMTAKLGETGACDGFEPLGFQMLSALAPMEIIAGLKVWRKVAAAAGWVGSWLRGVGPCSLLSSLLFLLTCVAVGNVVGSAHPCAHTHGRVVIRLSFPTHMHGVDPLLCAFLTHTGRVDTDVVLGFRSRVGDGAVRRSQISMGQPRAGAGAGAVGGAAGTGRLGGGGGMGALGSGTSSGSLDGVALPGVLSGLTLPAGLGAVLGGESGGGGGGGEVDEQELNAAAVARLRAEREAQ